MMMEAAINKGLSFSDLGTVQIKAACQHKLSFWR